MKTTVYKHYLVLPDEKKWFEVFQDESMVEDFSMVKYVLANLAKHYNESDDNWYYLYGVTQNKKDSEMFSYTHDDKLFKVIPTKMSEHEAEIFLRENSPAKIKNVVISSERDDKSLLLTKAECTELSDMEYGYVNSELVENSLIDYSCLKDKYIKALDFLMYCTVNKMHGVDSDYYTYQLSYGVSAEGYLNNRAGFRMDIVGVYAKLFRMLLRKEL